jgi:hypothetical protein
LIENGVVVHCGWPIVADARSAPLRGYDSRCGGRLRRVAGSISRTLGVSETLSRCLDPATYSGAELIEARSAMTLRVPPAARDLDEEAKTTMLDSCGPCARWLALPLAVVAILATPIGV